MRNILITDDANSSSLPKYTNLNCKNEVRQIPYDTCGKLVKILQGTRYFLHYQTLPHKTQN